MRFSADQLLLTGSFPEYRQGQNIKTNSIITVEATQIRLSSALREMIDTDRTPLKFQKLLTDPLYGLFKEIPNAPRDVSVSTAERWMKYLGFTATRASKGWFTDGHERADVIEYRGKFIADMKLLEPRMRNWSGPALDIEHLPDLPVGVKEAVIITHDESTFYCTEGHHIFWMENGKKKLLPKSRGQSIMISGFMCACHGFMSAEIDGIKYKSHQYFEAGSGREGWFTNAHLNEQFRNCLILFRHYHPLEHFDLYFGFDHSMTHKAKSPDGLDASKLNKSDGGTSVQK